MSWQYGLMLLALWAAASMVGCGQTGSEPTQAMHEAADSKSTSLDEHTHDGWWCVEHGIPEEQCGQCSAKLAAEFQKKGDWCKEHDRPESQCFICHPQLATEFAALYEAKYGEPPPKPTE